MEKVKAILMRASFPSQHSYINSKPVFHIPDQTSSSPISSVLSAISKLLPYTRHVAGVTLFFSTWMAQRGCLGGMHLLRLACQERT